MEDQLLDPGYRFFCSQKGHTSTTRRDAKPAVHSLVSHSGHSEERDRGGTSIADNRTEASYRSMPTSPVLSASQRNQRAINQTAMQLDSR